MKRTYHVAKLYIEISNSNKNNVKVVPRVSLPWPFFQKKNLPNFQSLRLKALPRKETRDSQSDFIWRQLVHTILME